MRLVIYISALLSLAALCSAFLFGELSEPSPRIGPGYVIPWEARSTINNEDYPCPSEDFFPHPTNCSRFYRCVDFANTSTIYSRFLFECPSGNVFAKDVNTCVPGSCPGSAATVDTGDESASEVVDPTEETLPINGEDSSSLEPAVNEETISPDKTESPAIPAAEGSGATSQVVPEVSPPTGEVDHLSQVNEFPEGIKPLAPYPPIIPSDAPIVPETAKPTIGVGSSNKCVGLYQQHAEYCNMFHLCNNDTYIYACNAGTAFHTGAQMCRVIVFDVALCEGKTSFEMTSSLLRSDEWGKKAAFALFYPPVENAMQIAIRDLSEEEQVFLQIYGSTTASESSYFSPYDSFGPSRFSPYVVNTRQSYVSPYSFRQQMPQRYPISQSDFVSSLLASNGYSNYNQRAQQLYPNSQSNYKSSFRAGKGNSNYSPRAQFIYPTSQSAYLSALPTNNAHFSYNRRSLPFYYNSGTPTGNQQQAYAPVDQNQLSSLAATSSNDNRQRSTFTPQDRKADHEYSDQASGFVQYPYNIPYSPMMSHYYY